MTAGRIVTFYSYKGGTGRSMALANVAWILASNGRRVLAMDWNLESPGLDHYFHPFMVNRGAHSSRGVIDLVADFASATMVPNPVTNAWVDDADWVKDQARILRYAVSLDQDFQDDGTLDFVSAGRPGPAYATRVNKLHWDALYDKHGAGAFLEFLREDMRENYDYVLVDSRTGLSDTAGVCTLALPDTLVNCFTLSAQSVDGALMVTRSVLQQTARDLRVIPVPMRVEEADTARLKAGRAFARIAFADLLAELDPGREAKHWSALEIPYKASYAYEEILATVGDPPGQEDTLLAAFERLTSVVTEGEIEHLVPMVEAERQRRLTEYSRISWPAAHGVIVSHTGQDLMWATWIEDRLREAGHPVMCQGPDLSFGTGDRADVDRMLAGIHHLVVVLTPDYVESPYARLTWETALERDRLVSSGLLLPVRVNDFRPPGTFGSRLPVDLVGLPAEQARTELLAAMHAPDEPPPDLSSTPPDRTSNPRFPGTSPHVFAVPSRNGGFVGRDALLVEIHERLARASTVAVLPKVTHAHGGVGTTQIAVEYAYRFAADYDLVWWAPAGQVAEARASLTELAPKLGLVPRDDASETLRMVLDALGRGEPFARWLLLFDDAPAAVQIEALLPRVENSVAAGHVLVTSLSRDWSAGPGDIVEAGVLARKESIQLVARRARQIAASDTDRLAARLGDLPLLLEQAAVWHAETAMRVDEYLRAIEAQLDLLSSNQEPTSLTTSVAAAWGIACERLQSQSPAALQLLELGAFFGPAPISLRLLDIGHSARGLPEPLGRALADPARLRRELLEIVRYALAAVDLGRGTMTVHRLVQEALQRRLSADRRDGVRACAHDLLAAANPGNPDDPDTWERHALLSPHLVPAGLIEARDPEIRKVVLDQMRFRYCLGDLDGCRELAELALSKWTASLGSENQQTLMANTYLTNAREASGMNEANTPTSHR